MKKKFIFILSLVLQPLSFAAYELSRPPLLIMPPIPKLKTQVVHQTRLARFTSAIDRSLWESVIRVGLNRQVVFDLADIFLWQVDFSRDLQKGDRWAVLVEEHLDASGKKKYGRIVWAELSLGSKVHHAVYFNDPVTKEANYFDLQGHTLKGQFLKSPIKFANITSSFKKRRFHPVLKKYRPHLGVDYAAKIGTPILAVADGVIEQIGTFGSAGKMMKIQHDSTYQTAYKHLSRFARWMKKGAKVKQGQVIGYVGKTGLASGPHLHFELFQNEKYIDPQKVNLSETESLPALAFHEFFKEMDHYMRLANNQSVPLPPKKSTRYAASTALKTEL